MMLGYKSNKNVVYSSKYHIVWCPKRSEEHTSELQSRLHLVCRLLLEKNKHAGAQVRPALVDFEHRIHVSCAGVGDNQIDHRIRVIGAPRVGLLCHDTAVENRCSSTC